MNNEHNYRRDVVDAIIPHARNDERIVLMVCDMGFGVTDRFKDEFPDRIFNCGMMEQGTVGIAAGMAMSGLIPVVYSIVNFLVFRAIEQIRNDVVLQNQNVKFIATGVNDYFKFLGPSHCCGAQDLEIASMIGLKAYDPYGMNEKSEDFFGLVKSWLLYEGPSYLRV